MPTDLLLCNPYFIKDDPVTRDAMDIYPLLGHGYLGSYLNRSGYSVEIFDATFEHGFDAYFDALAATRPTVVGVYGHLLSRDNAYAFARAAKERGLLTVAGGPDATGYYQDYLSNGFDIVVRSEGEETAREVMEWSRSGADPAQLHRILGIAYRAKDDQVALNGARPWIKDLDSIPFPRRDEHIHRPYLNNWQRVNGYTSLPILLPATFSRAARPAIAPFSAGWTSPWSSATVRAAGGEGDTLAGAVVGAAATTGEGIGPTPAGPVAGIGLKVDVGSGLAGAEVGIATAVWRGAGAGTEGGAAGGPAHDKSTKATRAWPIVKRTRQHTLRTLRWHLS